MTALVASSIALWVMVIILALGLYSMSRLMREFLTVPVKGNGMAVQGLSVGLQAPAFSESTVSGKRVSLEMGAEGETYLLFTSSGCMLCEHVLHEVGEHAEDLGLMEHNFIVLNDSGAGLDTNWIGFRLASRGLSVVAQTRLNKSYRVPSFPYLVIVDGNGTVSDQTPVASWKDINQALLRRRKLAVVV